MSKMKETVSALDYKSKSAFDYKGTPSTSGNRVQKNADRIVEAQVVDNNTVMKYSSVVKKVNIPNKELGVVLMATNKDIRAMEYIKNIGNIVTPKNITHASWMGNNRFCIFLKDVSSVDMLMLNRNFIKIDGVDIPMRRLVTPAKRIILSGVMPFVSDEAIENLLKANGLQVVSPVTHLKISQGDDEYSHILSFRRQVFIVPPESGELPASFDLEYQQENLRIFLESEKIICYKCKNDGHIARFCQNLILPPSNLVSSRLVHIEETKTGEKRDRETSSEIDSSNQSVMETDPSIIEATPNVTKVSKLSKRREVVTNKYKKIKNSVSNENEKIVSTGKLLKPLEKIIAAHPKKYCLSYHELNNFIVELRGSSNKIMVCKSYSTNLRLLCTTLHQLQPFLKQRQIKNIFSKIKTRITKYLGANKVEYSIASSSEDDDFVDSRSK